MIQITRVGGSLLLIGALASAPAPAQKTFSDVTEVVAVEIPVQVIRDGQPVRGLTAADFEVRDGRKRREILDFEAIDLTREGVGESPVEDIPVPARRHFLFLFDLALSQPSAVLRAQRAARRIVAEELHPTDLVGVGVYSVQGSKIVLGFTPDREQIEIAIDTLGMRSLLYGSPDPLGLVLTDAPPGSVPIASGSVGGVDPDAEIRQFLESMRSAATVASERNSVLALSSSLSALAQMIGSVYARKHVVFFSEGFESSSPLGLGVETERERTQAQSQAESAASGRYWEVNSDRRFGETAVLGELEQMTKEFVRAGASVHTVDIGGIRAGADVRARRSSTDGLFLMADQTGGELYRNFNDLGAAMRSLLDRTSVTYVLTIQPTDLPLDGRYRTLKVKLRNQSRGAELIHRPGYFAPKPFAEQSGFERRLVTAQLLLGDREGGRIEIDVRTRPRTDRKSGLEVVIAVDGPSLLAGHRGKKLSLEVLSYAIDPRGRIRDFLSKTLTFELDKTGEELRDKGYVLGGQLKLPAGEYTLRTLVRDLGTGEVGLRTSAVTIPAGA